MGLSLNEQSNSKVYLWGLALADHFLMKILSVFVEELVPELERDAQDRRLWRETVDGLCSWGLKGELLLLSVYPLLPNVKIRLFSFPGSRVFCKWYKGNTSMRMIIMVDSVLNSHDLLDWVNMGTFLWCIRNHLEREGNLKISAKALKGNN